MLSFKIRPWEVGEKIVQTNIHTNIHNYVNFNIDLGDFMILSLYQQFSKSSQLIKKWNKMKKYLIGSSENTSKIVLELSDS